MPGPIPMTSGGPPAIPEFVLVQQKQGQAVMIWAIGAFCIFGWEWLLCLPKEYQRIWKRPMNTSSVLYIVNRYFGLLQLSFVVAMVSNAWSTESSGCRHVFFFEPVGALISTILSQMILGTRVYAICSQNKIVGFVLGSTILTEIIIGGIAISTTHSPLPVPGPPSSQPPCGAVMGPFGWLIAFWSIPLFYDTLVFLLTAWKAYEFWKREVNTHLFDIIWRDGVLYFFTIFFMNAANVIIFLTVPKALRSVNLTPTLILEVILSCRLVLNLREAHSRLTHSSQPRWGSNSASKPPLNPTHGASSGEGVGPFGPEGVKMHTVRRIYDDSVPDMKVKPWNE